MYFSQREGNKARKEIPVGIFHWIAHEFIHGKESVKTLTP
jgi:hypothetical protein